MAREICCSLSINLMLRLTKLKRYDMSGIVPCLTFPFATPISEGLFVSFYSKNLMGIHDKTPLYTITLATTMDPNTVTCA